MIVAPSISVTALKEFFRRFMESDEYQENIKERILEGKATGIEQTGLYYTAGKPKEEVKVDSPDMARLITLALTRPKKKE